MQKKIPENVEVKTIEFPRRTAFGWYLTQLRYYNNPATGKSVYVSSTRLGKLIPKPEHAEDVEKFAAIKGRGKKAPPREYFNLVPTKEKYRRKDQRSQPGGELTQIAQTVKDARVPYLIRSPLWIVLMVVFMAAMSGLTTAVHIADYWRTNRRTLEEVFGDEFPSSDISHDTVRRLLMHIDASEQGRYLRHLFRAILSIFLNGWNTRLVAIDGQAARACKGPNGRPRFTLSAVDCDLRITLDQVQVADKTNEITAIHDLLHDMDLTNCVAVADALLCQRDIVSAILEKNGDYCLSLKGGGASSVLFEEARHIAEIFFQKLDSNQTITLPYKSGRTVEKGHGREEIRDFYALPGSLFTLMKAEPGKQQRRKKIEVPTEASSWPGVTEGTLFLVRSKKTNNTTGEVSEALRFFISSFDFDQPHIVERGIRSIRKRWGIESLHWEVDLQMGQDHIHMSNSQYIRVQRMLARIGNAAARWCQHQFEEANPKKRLSSVTSVMIASREPKALLAVLGQIPNCGALEQVLNYNDDEEQPGA